MIFNIIKANKEIKDLQEQINQLESDNNKLLESVKTHEQREATYALGSQDWASEKEKLVSEHEESIKKMKEDYESQLKNLSEKLEKADKTAAEKAAQIVSAIGIEPETIKISSVPSNEDIYKTFTKLQGPERQKFYQEHRELILKYTGLLK